MSSSDGQGLVKLPLIEYRRLATRYEPARRDACLSWWESLSHASPDPGRDENPDEAEPQRHFALLIDISQSSRLVALDKLPEEDSDVWLRLEGESVTDWSRANVVGVTTTARGPHLVRLAFRALAPSRPSGRPSAGE